MSAHNANENENEHAIDLGISGIEAPEQVGAGASGVVYRARQTHLQRDVAIKVVTIAGVEPTEKDRFARECGILGGLSRHPNIVTVFDSGETTTGLPYLVMEYVVGGSLSGQVLSAERLATVAVQLASALAEAHTTGVLHRDIKPANILSDEFGTPLLADFGLAVFANPDGYLATRGSIGTPAYMAPELFDADGQPTAATDMYAYGATLYALACGTAPFSAGAANALSIMQRALTEEPVDLRTFGVPDALAQIIHDCLAKRPEDRLGSMLEAARRFQSVQASSGWAITPVRVSGEEPVIAEVLSAKPRDVTSNRTVMGAAIGRRGTRHEEQPQFDTVVGPAVFRRPAHESDARSFAKTDERPAEVQANPVSIVPITGGLTAASNEGSGSSVRHPAVIADGAKAPAGPLLAAVIVLTAMVIAVAALGGVALAGGLTPRSGSGGQELLPAEGGDPDDGNVTAADASTTTSTSMVGMSTTTLGEPDGVDSSAVTAIVTSSTVTPATVAPATVPRPVPTTQRPTTTTQRPTTTTSSTTDPTTTTIETTTTTIETTTTTEAPTTTTAPESTTTTLTTEPLPDSPPEENKAPEEE